MYLFIYTRYFTLSWSYDQNQLVILLSKIEEYEADYYVTGHQDPKTHEEMWAFFDELISIGEIVGDEISFDQAVTKFTEVRKTKPSEEQLKFIHNFVNGNRKKGEIIRR